MENSQPFSPLKFQERVRIIQHAVLIYTHIQIISLQMMGDTKVHEVFVQDQT